MRLEQRVRRSLLRSRLVIPPGDDRERSSSSGPAASRVRTRPDGHASSPDPDDRDDDPDALEDDPDDEPEDDDFDSLLREVARAPSVDALPLGDEELAPGTVLDGCFRIVRRLGRGGMGVVYLADHLQLERKVALKLCSAAAGKTGTSRLLREARTMASLVHDNVVTVYDVGTVDDRVYIAMEFVDGGTVRDWLARRPRTWAEIVRVFVAAGRGLAAAHAAGLVHRDFKPDNVLMGLDGRVRVADFGLARAAGGDDGVRLRWRDGARPTAEGRSVAATTEHGLQLTATGALVGTPAYMAPEQHEGAVADGRSDQFAFCVSLYEGLYGERPFRGKSLAELVTHVVMGEPVVPPRGHEVPTWIRRVLQRGLARDPAQRFPGMDALLRELSRDPAAARRRALGLVAAVGVVVSGVLVAQQVGSGDPCAGGEARIGEVWGPSQGAALQQVLAERGGPVGAAVGPRVRTRLDAHAEVWAAAYREACEATRLRQVQSEQALELRMACLDGRRDELAALVEALGRGDADVAARADQATLSLSSVGPCADVEALRRVEPIAAADREAAEAVRREVAQAKGQLDAGRYADSLARAEQALARARGLGYASLQAQALQRTAEARMKLGEREAASEAYEQALVQAVAAGDDRAALAAAVHLVYADGYQLERFDLGERWLRQADAWRQRLGETGLPLVWRYLYEGLMRREQGRLNDAVQALQRAGREAAALPDDDAARDARLGVVAALAVTLGVRGDVEAALAAHDEALALTEQLYGPAHPRLATELNNAAAIRLRQGDPAGAEALLRRALEIRSSSFGPDHRSVLESSINLAMTLTQQQRLDEATALLQQAERHAEGAEPRLRVELHGILGLVLTEQRRYDDAEAELRRALTVARAAWAPDDPQGMRVLTNLANLANRRERFAEAEQLAREGLAIVADSPREELGLPAGYLQVNLGDALLRQDRHAEARAAYEAALARIEVLLGPEHPHLHGALLGLGESLVRTEQPALAEPILQRALGLVDGVDPPSRGATRFALAQAKWATGDRDGAHALARQALVDYEGAPPHDRDRVEAWLRSHPAR